MRPIRPQGIRPLNERPLSMQVLAAYHPNPCAVGEERRHPFRRDENSVFRGTSEQPKSGRLRSGSEYSAGNDLGTAPTRASRTSRQFC